MNKLIASVLSAALCAALVGQVRGGDLEIMGFSVERQSDGKVFVHGALKNKSSVKSLVGIEYAFTQFDGKIWVPVKGYTVVLKSSDPIKSLGPADNVGVWAYLANVPDSEQKFALTARIIANNKVVDIAEDKSFTLKARAKEPEKPKKPTLTLVEWKPVTRLLTHNAPGTPGYDAVICRVYVSGQMYPFDRAGNADLSGDEIKQRKFNFSSRPRLLGDKPVIVQVWKIPSVGKDVKLGEAKILPTESSGERTIPFTGSYDGELYKYEVKYRIDR